MTFHDAARRVLATTIQAAAGCGIILIGLVAAGNATSAAVTSTIAGSFVVPVLTAVHRYVQAWVATFTDTDE
jgi:hypothetical protein